jgi:hypothetical protein
MGRFLPVVKNRLERSLNDQAPFNTEVLYDADEGLKGDVRGSSVMLNLPKAPAAVLRQKKRYIIQTRARLCVISNL